jgi:hypothetical protein
MQAYEYIRLGIDMGDLSALNRYSADGWRVVSIVATDRSNREQYALLERPLPPQPVRNIAKAIETQEYFDDARWGKADD